ncbi:MAG: TIGR02281 family clan AA aspartic protease [Rhodobacteraceae bacterium]|nr:TIGR02281 family clan AA aspartic protease [Paracoccaceae bacterium]
MGEFELGRLAYLVILGAVLIVWFVIHHRETIGRTLQQAVAWGLIFLGVVAAFGLWGDIRQTVTQSQAVFEGPGRIEVPRARDGHYYLTLNVNGAPVRFVVDTGATDIVLSHDDADKIGLQLSDLAFVGRAMTANGEVRTAPVRLDSLSLGPIADTNVPAWINEGEMRNSLLGMSYLQRWEKIEISNGSLVLTR